MVESTPADAAHFREKNDDDDRRGKGAHQRRAWRRYDLDISQCLPS